MSSNKLKRNGTGLRRTKAILIGVSIIDMD